VAAGQRSASRGRITRERREGTERATRDEFALMAELLKAQPLPAMSWMIATADSDLTGQVHFRRKG
jgi:hypothetical protein